MHASETAALCVPGPIMGGRGAFGIAYAFPPGQEVTRAVQMQMNLIAMRTNPKNKAAKKRDDVRHLEERCKQFLRSTDDIVTTSIAYPGGLRGLVQAREAAVNLLLQVMRETPRPVSGKRLGRNAA